MNRPRSNPGSSSPPGPLSGCRVLELCTTVAGPACTRHLADYGAEVIKIEPLGGDPVRSMGFHEGDVSLYAASILRNKKSVAIDLKTPEGIDLARQLAARCDIVVENFRPGKLEQLGLGYDVLSSQNPGVILVRISGYGQTGPGRGKPGYGTICEAYGGVRHVTGYPDRPPARVSVALTDYLASLYAAFGAVLAVHERDRSGRGQVVDVALFEAAFSLLEPDVPAFDRLGRVANREGSNFPGLAPNNLYATSDGAFLLIAANNDAIFRRLCVVLGEPELANDPRFRTIRSRAAHAREIDTIVGAWAAGRPSREALIDLERAAVPGSLVYTMKDAFDDPQYRARRTIARVPHRLLGSVAMTGLVAKLSRTPGKVRRAGPDAGADTGKVLRSVLGVTEHRIARLRRDRVIGGSSSRRKER